MSKKHPDTVREEILSLATKYVTSDRQAQHGAPENTFGLIAEYWSVYLGRPLGAHDIAAMMVLLKVARSQMNPAAFDNWVDMAGYAACGGELANEGLPSIPEPPKS